MFVSRVCQKEYQWTWRLVKRHWKTCLKLLNVIQFWVCFHVPKTNPKTTHFTAGLCFVLYNCGLSQNNQYSWVINDRPLSFRFSISQVPEVAYDDTAPMMMSVAVSKLWDLAIHWNSPVLRPRWAKMWKRATLEPHWLLPKFGGHSPKIFLVWLVLGSSYHTQNTLYKSSVHFGVFGGVDIRRWHSSTSCAKALIVEVKDLASNVMVGWDFQPRGSTQTSPTLLGNRMSFIVVPNYSPHWSCPTGRSRWHVNGKIIKLNRGFSSPAWFPIPLLIMVDPTLLSCGETQFVAPSLPKISRERVDTRNHLIDCVMDWFSWETLRPKPWFLPHSFFPFE